MLRGFSRITLLIILTVLFVQPARLKSADKSDYLQYVQSYAIAMIEKGRDVYGAEHSPLFAAALDRSTMRIGEFPAIEGIRAGDRTQTGANPYHDMALYSILYGLSEITGNKLYSAEADKALNFFITHCSSPETHLFTWGEHLFWDFNTETQGNSFDKHEINGPWPFWDQCYTFNPVACKQFALGLWQHQVADHETGDFSRHARWSSHGPNKGSDFPRYAGQMIEIWADAYSRPGITEQDKAELVRAITCIVNRMEENSKSTATGYLPALRGADYAWPSSNLELARCLWGAAGNMGPELAERMKTLATQQDTDFLRAPHKVLSGGGFAATLHTETGEPRDRSMNKPYTALWASGYGYGTHAAMANRSYQRYLQLQKAEPEKAGQYHQLIIAAADQYLHAEPDTTSGVKPDAVSDIINLMLNTYEMTDDKIYLDRANEFAQWGISLFLDNGLPLPKASSRHTHYEALTGGPDFMYALLRIYDQNSNK